MTKDITEPASRVVPPAGEACCASSTVERETANGTLELRQELRDNSPLHCHSSFMLDEHSGRASEVMLAIQIFAVLLRRKHPWLNFRALGELIVAEDYGQALRDLGAREGRDLEPTNDAIGVGAAMVIPCAEHCVAVLSADVARGLLSEDDGVRDPAVDILLHELCHVHDHGRRQRLLPSTLELSPKQETVFKAADSAWSEYFANKYSTTDFSGADMHAKLLADLVPSVIHNVQAAIRTYRVTEDTKEMCRASEQSVTRLFQFFGYAAGRLHANATTLYEVAPESVAALEKAGLFDVWNSLCQELSRLDKSKENWQSYAEYTGLMDLAQTTLSRLGLHYFQSERGLSVNVPFTPETMPAAAQVVTSVLARLVAALNKRGVA